MITAEKVYKEILDMPLAERERLFVTIARRGFEKDFYKHDEVFDDIRQAPFSLKEAALYLEVADITVRRWVRDSKIRYRKIGRNLVFDPADLKALKKKKLKKPENQ
jgi:excisionase family DNA binding protein